MHKMIIIILALVIFLILWNTGLVGIRLDSQDSRLAIVLVSQRVGGRQGAAPCPAGRRA